MAASAFSITGANYEDDLGRDVRVVVMRNTITGELAEILLNTPGGDNRSNGSGAVNGLLLRDRVSGELREVMPHRRGFVGGLMAPFANRVKNGTYRFAGQAYQLTPNWDETATRISRAGPHAIHGLLPRELQHLSRQAADDGAQLMLGASFDGSDAGYPFPVDVTFAYSLRPSGFSIEVAATNTSGTGQPAPFMVGWHPYVMLRGRVDRAVIAFDDRSAFNRTVPVHGGPAGPERDSHPSGASEPATAFREAQPLGDRYWDDGFKAIASTKAVPTLETRVTEDGAGGSRVSDIVLWQDAQCRFIQIYTGLRDQGAVAIEPMSGQTNCFNNGDGLVVLQAGETWETGFGAHLDSEGHG